MSGAYVRVRVGQEHYALPIADVLEVVKLQDPTPVPGAPETLPGVINRRGQVLALVDLSLLLGTTADSQPTRLLVVDDGRRCAGLAVDEVLDVGPMQELSVATESDLLAATALIDGEVVGVLETERILDAAASG